MKTLQELIVAARCRKGAAAGTTKKGAYWLACEPIKIRVYGGDGIGQSRADMTNWLQLRHFRDGAVQITIRYHSWHQNDGHTNGYVSAGELANCESIEDVIVGLKGISDPNGVSAYSDYQIDNLVDGLTAFGMAMSAPAPDEETTEEPG
jgi:hypothetical protein